MRFLGCSAGLLAALTFLIGLIPFLGWINWFTTLPLATFAAATSFSATREQPAVQSQRMAFAASVILIVITLFRLSIGGGFI